jgi:hypothetical protein
MVATQRLAADTQAAFPVVLRTVVGSDVHGTGLPGLGDVDHMAVAVEYRDDVLGLGSSPESWAYRTAWERADVEGSDPRSSIGDLDLIVYPARKWAKLALAGNPSAVAPMFVDDRHVISANEFGAELRENRHRFISRSLATKHIGYMSDQRTRLEGDLKSMRVSRPELKSAHGYDTKYASHLLRLGHQGLAVLVDGTLPIPLDPDTAESILAVRRGEREIADVLEEADRLLAAMIAALDTTTIPVHGDAVWISEWLARSQLSAWAAY